MSKFHISKSGKPAPCKANIKCPLVGSPHFETEKEADDYIQNESEKEYGLLPFESEISKEWKKRFLESLDYNEFIKKNAKDIMNDKLYEGKDPRIESLNTWKSVHYENSSNDMKELSKEKAIEIIRNKMRSGDLHGWFREYDSDYKPKIEQAMITDPEIREAGMNLAYDNYKSIEKDLTFDEFLNKDVTVYRGGNFDFVNNDVFISYSFDKKVAEKFSSRLEESEVKELKIKMKNTLGSLQTTGELEIMVPKVFYN